MARHINDSFIGATKPEGRPTPAKSSGITTMSVGEPEKDFTRPPVKPVPKPRPIPEDEPAITTLSSGEPEKDFGRLISPDFD